MNEVRDLAQATAAQELFNIKQLPAEQYWIKMFMIKTREDGSTVRIDKVFPRPKAFRLLNQRPFNWVHTMFQAEFKHEWRLA